MKLRPVQESPGFIRGEDVNYEATARSWSFLRGAWAQTWFISVNWLACR